MCTSRMLFTLLFNHWTKTIKVVQVTISYFDFRLYLVAQLVKQAGHL